MSATQLATGLLFEAKPRWSGTIGAGGVAAAGTTTIPLSSAANLDNGDAYVFVINRVTTSGAKNELSEMETVIGELSGTNFVNCVRGQEGTAQAWEAGIVVEILFTATHWNKMIDAFTAEHSPDDGTHKDVTATSVTSETIEATTSADLKTLAIDGGTAMTAVKDEDDMASNSATALATQQSIKAYVDTQDTLYTNTNIGMARQAIINGNFDVSQRATTFVAGANNDDVYTLDHWNLISDGNDVLDVSQEAITDLPGSNYAIKLDVETAKRAGIVQFLEAKDAQKFKGKTVSISFAVKSANISAIRATVLSWSSTADAITSDIVGTWAATPTWATNWADNATPADLTVTSSWTTVKVEGIAIDEATVNNLALAIWLPNEETIGDIVYISQVQMNMGSVALPFQPKSYAQELADCQRYYWRSTTAANHVIGFGMAVSTTVFKIGLTPNTQMRIKPAIEVVSVYGSDGVSTFVGVTPTVDAYSDNLVWLSITTTGLTQFRPYYLSVYVAPGGIGLSAEL